MSRGDPKYYPITLDKREAVTEIKKNLKVEWKRKFDLSEKVDHIQEIFTGVGYRNCFGENDRQFLSTVNQLLTGHSSLNNHKAKTDPKVSNLCSVCHLPEETYHTTFSHVICSRMKDTFYSQQWKIF